VKPKHGSTPNYKSTRGVIKRSALGYKTIDGIPLLKKFGQHFLRDEQVLEHIVAIANLPKDAHVIEIGCGQGALTKKLLEQPIAQVLVFEIDPAWSEYVGSTIQDPRLKIITDDVLAINLQEFLAQEPYIGPWHLCANLPYNITFPLVYKLFELRDRIPYLTIMIQEEVAQRIVATYGRSLGFHSLYLQHYATWELHQKIAPGAFFPPPKVNSRVLHATWKHPEPIPHEPEFWKFIKRCFEQPRRMLSNNLAPYAYDTSTMNQQYLIKRAQEMTMTDFLTIWSTIRPQ
jgi:16S rRNA (adenine1518-N6/adenine1519-N6)-dimethyltransferase